MKSRQESIKIEMKSVAFTNMYYIETSLSRYIARKCQTKHSAQDQRIAFEPLSDCIFQRVPFRKLKIRVQANIIYLNVRSTDRGFQVVVDTIISRNKNGAVRRFMAGLCGVLGDYARHVGGEIQVDLVARGVINQKMQEMLSRLGFQSRVDIQPDRGRRLLWAILSMVIVAAIFIQTTDLFAIAFLCTVIMHKTRRLDFGYRFTIISSALDGCLIRPTMTSGV